MPKVTLNKEAFKALASETRLGILKNLDGTKMSLTDLCTATNLNKATLHEHLKKLIETGIVKKIQRPGHKWVYYTLSWKGESLLHPENTKIVIMFSVALITLIAAIIQIYLWAKGTLILYTNEILSRSPPLNTTEDLGINESIIPYISDGGQLLNEESMMLEKGIGDAAITYQEPLYLVFGIICFIFFCAILSIVILKLWKNRTAQL
jgi:DNA-binding transcriptional ArsR family regulator